eukprot:277401-Rhodomonas_salina.1
MHDWTNGCLWPDPSARPTMERCIRNLTETQLAKDSRAPTSVQPFEALHYPLPPEVRVQIATSH